MNSYALYLAMKMVDDPRPARCCSDEPTGRAVASRPVAPVRWTTRLARAVPGSLRVIRAAFREPASRSAPSVGAMVIRLDGSRVGHVNEVLVSLESGMTALSIQTAEAPGGHVILLPTSALEPAGEPDVFVATGLGRSPNAA